VLNKIFASDTVRAIVWEAFLFLLLVSSKDEGPTN
jgi:hypothetical protein